MTRLSYKLPLNLSPHFIWFRPGFAHQPTKVTTLRMFATTTSLLMAISLNLASVTTLAQEVKEKRKFDNRIPDHLPIKVRIKNEKEEAFQDLENPNWPEDFEVELQNTGTRPIYSISLTWTIWELKFSENHLYGSSFRYGRNEFIAKIGERPKPEDVPIQPGEVRTFKMRKEIFEGLEVHMRDNYSGPIKSISLLFDFLTFGDDTGFESPDGRPFDRRIRQASPQ